MNRPRSFWPALLIVAIIATIGGLVRWLIAADQLLWLDELHTSWVVAGDVGDVYQRAFNGNQTPFYFWLSWASVQIFGETEVALRLVSLAAGIATIFAAGWTVLRWTDSTIAAVTTSVLIALDVQFIYYATEARPYALIQFLGVVQVLLFWRLFVGGERSATSLPGFIDPAKPAKTGLPLAGLCLVTALLFYTHYTTAWLFVGEVVFVLVLLVVDPAFRRMQLGKILGVSVATALICIPALLQLKQLLARRSNWSSVSSVPDLLVQQTMPMACWVLIPVVAVAIVYFARAEKFFSAESHEKTSQTRRLCFVFLWAVVPTLGVVMVDFFKLAPMALIRYTLVGAVAMPIFAGLIIGIGGHRNTRIVLAVVLLALSVTVSPVTSGRFVSSGFDASEFSELRTEDWRTPVEEINASQAKSHHPVFLAANLIEDVDAFENLDPLFQEYLCFPVRGLHRIANQQTRTEDPKEEALDSGSREVIPIPTLPMEHLRPSDIRKIKQSGGAWLIVRGTTNLALEIEDEIVNKYSALFPDAQRLEVGRFQVPNSDVYLISFDW